MSTATQAQVPTMHAADSHDLIRVHGARVNNLRDVSPHPELNSPP